MRAIKKTFPCVLEKSHSSMYSMPLSTFEHLRNFGLNYLQGTHIWLLKWGDVKREANRWKRKQINTITQQKPQHDLPSTWTARKRVKQPPTLTPATKLEILICL